MHNKTSTIGMKKIISALLILAIFGLQISFAGNTKYDEVFKKLEYEANFAKIAPDYIYEKLDDGNFKAEYIPTNSDYSKSDAIKITQNGKSWEIPGVYDINNESNRKSGEACIIYDDCWAPKVDGFVGFSPSGYYLTINQGSYVGNIYTIIETKTGKKVSDLGEYEDTIFSSWTKDKKQFIAGGGSRFGLKAPLSITIKGAFPKTKELLSNDYQVLGGYVDEKNIYIENFYKGKYYNTVIEITSGKILYSKELFKEKITQGNFSAEYIGNNGDYSKSDIIKITQNGKSWNIPGFYNIKNKEDKERGDSCMSGNDGCFVPTFEKFIGFSPSGYYLMYSGYGYENNPYKMVDVKTGKTVLNLNGTSFNSWTKDKSQFVYGEIYGLGTEGGLFITQKGSFPKVQKVLSGQVSVGTVDEKNIYILWTEDGETLYKKVIDLKTLKVIYSEKL